MKQRVEAAGRLAVIDETSFFGLLEGPDPRRGWSVKKVVNKYKVAKHFQLEIEDDAFAFRIDEKSVTSEVVLDVIYVIRTSLPKERLSAADTMCRYKDLVKVERVFRSLKTINLKVQPIY